MTGSATSTQGAQPVTRRAVGISAAAAIGGFLFGFDTAVINGAVDAIRGDFALSAAWIGFAVSVALLGSAVGAWYAGVLADRYGLVIDTAEQTLWGESAEGATARRLEAPLHTPLLVFRRVSSAAGKPVEYVVSRYRGDRYQVHMSLGATQTTRKTPR